MKKVIFLLFILLQTLSYSQNLEGMEGLFFIPSAEISQDAKVTIGVNYLDKNLISFGGFKNNATNYFLSLNFLPFIESSLRITRLNGLPSINNQAIGDRTANIKIRLFEESNNQPAIAFGIHDLFTVFGGEGAVHNNACYLVVTKNFKLDMFLSNIDITIGYGSDLMRAANNNFVGVFCGLTFRLFEYFDLILEYDSKRVNGGLKAKFFNHFNLLVGSLDFKNVSGGISYSFQL